MLIKESAHYRDFQTILTLEDFQEWSLLLLEQLLDFTQDRTSFQDEALLLKDEKNRLIKGSISFLEHTALYNRLDLKKLGLPFETYLNFARFLREFLILVQQQDADLARLDATYHQAVKETTELVTQLTRIVLISAHTPAIEIPLSPTETHETAELVA